MDQREVVVEVLKPLVEMSHMIGRRWGHNKPRTLGNILLLAKE